MNNSYFSPVSNKYDPASAPVVYMQENLQHIIQGVEDGRCCHVLGPRQRGKSTLMRSAAQKLQDKGSYYTSYVSLRRVPAQDEQSFFSGLISDVLLVTESEFFSRLYQGIANGFSSLQTAAVASLPDSAEAFRDALRTLVRRSRRHLVVFIDDLETAPPNLVASLLGALAAVYTAVAHTEDIHFMAVVCGSLSLGRISSELIENYHAVSRFIWVDELNEEEREAFVLASCSQNFVKVAESSIETLVAQTGGDHFLLDLVLKKCFMIMKQRGQTNMTPARVSEAIDFVIKQSPDQFLQELQRFIESDPHLMYYALYIIEHQSIAANRVRYDVEQMPNLIDLCGVFTRENGMYRIKSELWQRLLQKNLNVARIGGLYAIAGYWKEAFRYLGIAVNQGQESVKSELFTAITNAMYTSQTPWRAYEYLWLGLDWAYPDNNLKLYALIENSLMSIQPKEITGELERIMLSERERPEVSSLSGSDYAIAEVGKETRLFIPLRGDNNEVIGLASFGNLVRGSSPYRQRDELLQLIGFLRQAARVIQDRARHATLLQSAQTRGDKLNFLNSVLTSFLHRRGQSEQGLLRLCLAGVVSHLGLGFSRAILFMPDFEGSYLNGRNAYGYLTRKEAAQAMARLEMLDLENLVKEMLDPERQQNPLQNRLQNFQVPLQTERTNLLADVYQNAQAVSTHKNGQPLELPAPFVQAIGAPDNFALVPLQASAQTIGVLYVDDRFTDQTIDSERYELLQAYANQTALLLENERAFRAEWKRNKDFRILLKVEEALNDQITNSVKGVLNCVVQSALNLFGADNAVVYPLQLNVTPSQHVYDVENVTAVGTKHPLKPSTKARSEAGISAHILKTPKGIWSVANVQKSVKEGNGRILAASDFIEREKIGGFVGIRLGQIDEPVGILYINWLKPYLLTQEEVTLLELFANFVAVAIPSARSYQHIESDLTRRKIEQEGLNQVTSRSLLIYSEEEVEAAIQATMQIAQSYTNASYVYLFRDEPHSIWRKYWLSVTGEVHSEFQNDLPEGMVQHAFAATRSVLVTGKSKRQNKEFPERINDDAKSKLAVPVRLTGHCFAVLYLESLETNGLKKDHETHLENVTRQFAHTLERADRTQALFQLQEISQHLTSEINLQSVLAYLVKQARSALRSVDVITLYYIDQESDQLMLGYMSGAQSQATIGQSFATSVPIIDQLLASEKPLFAPDMRIVPTLDSAFVSMEKEIKSAAAFPLQVGDQRVGCMFFGYHFFHRFSEDEQSLLNLFAQLASLAILRATLHDEGERRRKRLETIARMTPIISASLEKEAVLRAVLGEIKEAFPKANNVCFVQSDMGSEPPYKLIEALDYYQVDDVPYRAQDDHTKVRKRRGISGRVLETEKAEMITNVHHDPDYIPEISSTRSELCAPLMIDGEAAYALVVESDELDAFDAEDLRLLEMLTEYIAVAIHNADQFEQARARELNERTAMMATGLIHDINTAVANIPDLVDELEMKLELGGDISFPLDDLRESADVTDKISGRLREFVITGQYQPAVVDVSGMISSALNISKAHKPKYVNVTAHYCDPLPKVEADRLWIELLLKNLLVNAYTAIPNDRDGVVRIEVETDESNVLIHVRDNGKGIPQEIKKDIFKFGISSKEGKNKMQGVGLYHCQLIAEAHNGKLTVDSEPGADTIFTLRLPIAEKSSLESEEGQENG